MAPGGQVLEPLREAQFKDAGESLQVERRKRVKLAKESLKICMRRRKENLAADADVRAKISRQVEQAQQELKNATEAATLKSCVEEQRRLYTKDLEFQKTTAFARLLLAAIKGDSMHKLLKLLALTDDVVSSASSLIPDLTPRDVTSHAAKVLFPSWKAPPPPSSDVLAGEGPVRKRQREEAEIAAMPRRAVPILHVACALNKAACLDLLLSLGVPANWDIEGYIMPIHIACHLRYIECCRILIAAGAAVEARNAQVRSLWWNRNGIKFSLW